MEDNKFTGYIYKIISNQTDKIYIGSTIRDLNERMREHKNKYKQYLNDKYCYVTSYDIVKFDDAKIELIKEVIFSDRKELNKIEGEYIKSTENATNKRVEGRTVKEYHQNNYQQNKEKIIERNQIYRENNMDRIKLHDKDRDQIKSTCECGSTFIARKKLKHERTLKHLNYMQNKSQI